ncbi:hypothetical protein [Actinokineospora sp.]|uniref:hypothetical protein n=1 Tax=Actinokineospora sp. TaxID=1872133 RepID=UPI003D6BF0FF
MGVRIDIRPAPAPRNRAGRGVAAAAFASRLAHAVLWLCVLATGDVLVALAVTHEHGRAAGAAVFALVLGAVMAAFTDWAIRELARPGPQATATVQEVQMGQHPAAVGRARIAAAFRVHGHPTAAAHARIAAAFRTHGRHTRYVVRTPRLAYEARHAVATTPITVDTKGH